MIDQGRIENAELGIVKHDGQKIWLEVTIAPIPLAGYGVAIAYRDVSDRKRAEAALREAHDELEQRVTERTADLTAANQNLQNEIVERKRIETALRQSEARMRALVENAPFDFWAIDLDGRFVMQNATSRRLWGNMVGRYRQDLDLPERTLHEMITTDRRAQGGQVVEGEYTVVRNDRELTFSSIVAPIRVGGDITGLLGVSIDTTERKEAEAALRESEKKFRALAETVTTAVFIIAKDRLLYGNRSTEQITGYRRDELYAMNLSEIIHPDFREMALKRALDRQQGKDQPTRYEMKFIRRDGKTRWLDVAVGVIHYEGQLASLVSGMDITERKEAEELLQDAHLKLLNAREEERRTLASELHDSFAQDLVVLQLMLQRGMTAPYGTDTERKWLGEASKMCGRLIQDIRHICHGLYPPSLETLGLRQALVALAEFYKVGNMDVEIDWDYPRRDVRFNREVEIVLFRIAQEALGNAMRHGHASHVDLKVSGQDGQVILDVIDNGKGFDIEQVESAGLGLQTMRERAHSVEGNCRINSQPRCTHIHVDVPARPLPQGEEDDDVDA
jgi:PAS domain S-box-containing protein